LQRALTSAHGRSRELASRERDASKAREKKRRLNVSANVSAIESIERSQADTTWIGAALDEADLAEAAGEVPVGCVIVSREGLELSRGRNARESLADPTAHAEMAAIRAAAGKIGDWRLEGTTAYVTLEPCAMCAGALVLARVQRVVFGCADPKAGAITTMFGIGVDTRLNHRFTVTAGVRAEDCARRLQRFFAALRERARDT
jgi:tRNA(adenine34) deaminase